MSRYMMSNVQVAAASLLTTTFLLGQTKMIVDWHMMDHSERFETQLREKNRNKLADDLKKWSQEHSTKTYFDMTPVKALLYG